MASTSIKLECVRSPKQSWPLPQLSRASPPQSWPNTYANSADKTKPNMAHVAPLTTSRSCGLSRSSSASAKPPATSLFPRDSEPWPPSSFSATQPSNHYSPPYSPFGQAASPRTQRRSMPITTPFEPGCWGNQRAGTRSLTSTIISPDFALSAYCILARQRSCRTGERKHDLATQSTTCYAIFCTIRSSEMAALREQNGEINTDGASPRSG